jgi:putative RecB family exonuclease
MQQPKKSIRAWSYSRLKDFEKCPQLYKFKVIDKLPEPQNAAMERGEKIHKLAEKYLVGGGKIPQELMRMKPELTLLRKLKAVAEDQWTFTEKFTGTTEWNNWAAAWLRVKIDAVVKLEYQFLPTIRELKIKKRKINGIGVWVLDWKTGQFRPEASVDQLELYVLTTFLLRPDAMFVLATLAYTDVGRLVHAYYENDPELIKRLKAKWLKRVEPQQKEMKFKPTPGAQCNWCHFRKSIGGPCKHG